MTLMSGAPGTVTWRDMAEALWMSGMFSTGKVEANSAAAEATERAPARSRIGEAIFVVPSTGDGRRRREACRFSSSSEVVGARVCLQWRPGRSGNGAGGPGGR